MFQNELPFAFSDADYVIIGEVARAEKLSPSERLNPEKLAQDISALGKSAKYIPEIDAIANCVATNVQGDDVVVIFSNGSFGGLHNKLLERLKTPW